MSAPPPEQAQPSVEEIVALLKKTALPTVICEGSSDLIVFRRLENLLSDLGVSVLPAGGRRNVLQIFERRAEIPASIRLAFIADRDTWVNAGVPDTYVSPMLCLTSGYSIENDVISDGVLENLLFGDELSAYRKELNDFLEWYALALNRHLENPSESIALHPEHVLDPVKRPSLVALRSGELYPTQLLESLISNYGLLVRGKSLLALLIRNTNKRPGGARYNEKALLEMVAARPGVLLNRIGNEVRGALAAE